MRNGVPMELLGVAKVVQATLNGIFAPCTVQIEPGAPMRNHRLVAKYRVNDKPMGFSFEVDEYALRQGGQGFADHLSRDIPHRIVMEALGAAKAQAERSALHFS